MRGLDWTVANLPLAAGLNQRSDDRARQPPYLDIAKDVEFTELGGIQTRHPFADLSADELADARRVYEFGDELLVFTKDSLLFYHQDKDNFPSRATYLAAKVDEKPVFVTTGDQFDCDRAQLSGMVVHVWTEGSSIYLALTDETTGSVTLSPVSVSGSRPRLVTLSTVIMLFWSDGTGNLVAAVLDPASDPNDIPGDIASPTTVLAAASFNVFYDVTRLLTTDTAVFACRRQITTSYTVGTITSAGVVTTSTKARTCDACIAIASHPAGTHVQIARTVTPAVVGDYIAISGLTDVTTAQAIGDASNTVDAITAAYRSVADSGQFRCYVFWAGDQGLTQDQTTCNYVDSGGTIGTEAVVARNTGLASRAFDHDGRVFVNVVFYQDSSFTGAEFAQLQNSYFLYRDDALLVAKMAATRAGGFGTNPVLPEVQLTSGTTGYTWCGTERRLIPISGIGNYTAYADRGPRDITVTFDSDDARRVAKLGNTLYIAGGEILQYDGVRLVEVGFHVYPYQFAATETAGGSIATNGSYTYKPTWRYDNSVGERERSTTATILTKTLAAQPGGFTFTDIAPLTLTHKTSPAVSAEMWRTEVNPVLDAPSFLVTSTDPADTSNPNRYLANDLTASALPTFNDELADTALSSLEQDLWAAELEDLAPPAASIIVATDTRLFLAGVAGDPHRIWYSKLRGADRVASFNDALTFDVPPVGGDITALAASDGSVIVWRERAIYAFAGQGFGNVGDADGSQNFQLVRTVSEDVGAVSHETVALTADGWLFKSSKGWHLLGKGGQLTYVGDKISDYDSDTVVAVHVLDGRHQVRVLTTSRMLVFDTVASQWSEWTIDDGIHACIWRGTYCYLTSTAVRDEQTDYTGVDFGMDVETAWIKLADLQGSVRIRKLLALGEYRGAHDLRFRVAYDYATSYTDDQTWTVSPTTVGGPLQVKLGPSRQQCQAFKVRITAQAVGTTDPPTGEALKLTGLGIEYGARPRLYNRLPSAQRR